MYDMTVKQLVRKMAAERGTWDRSGYDNYLGAILTHWLGAKTAWMKMEGPSITVYCYGKESADKIVNALDIQDYAAHPWRDQRDHSEHPTAYYLSFSLIDLVEGALRDASGPRQQ